MFNAFPVSIISYGVNSETGYFELFLDLRM